MLDMAKQIELLEDSKVQDICAAVHTQEVIDAYLAAQSPA